MSKKVAKKKPRGTNLMSPSLIKSQANLIKKHGYASTNESDNTILRKRKPVKQYSGSGSMSSQFDYSNTPLGDNDSSLCGDTVKSDQDFMLEAKPITPPRYNMSYRGEKIDPYRILKVYGITEPGQQHAIKKLLRAGKSHKSYLEDIAESIDALKRILEMAEEDHSDLRQG